MYEDGHTSSTARQKYLAYHIKKADRSITPRRRDFRYIYEEFGLEKYGGKNIEMLKKLVDCLDAYKEGNQEGNTAYQLYGGDGCPLIVAIVTPLMKRVHKYLQQSGELTFVDSTSNTNDHSIKVLLYCTHNVAGALPCAFLITSDEKESTLRQGFKMVKKCLPTYFFWKGPEQGPMIIMTDNCNEEQNALSFVWPSATLLLCIFHILQQVWRWLLDKNHQISQADRSEILSQFKQALYSDTEDSCQCPYSKQLHTMSVNDKAKEYFKSFYEERKSLALCYRLNILVKGNQKKQFC